MGIGSVCLILAAIFVWGAVSARAAAISTPNFFDSPAGTPTAALKV